MHRLQGGADDLPQVQLLQQRLQHAHLVQPQDQLVADASWQLRPTRTRWRRLRHREALLSGAFTLAYQPTPFSNRP